MRAAVLTNPHSSRNRRLLASVERQLEGRVLHRVTASAAELPRVIDELAAERIELLGINGGDGTVHEVLSEMARTRSARDLPAIALIPGGTTNMSARDVNTRPLRLRDAIDEFLAAARDGRTPRPREVIRIQDGADSPRLGFIFGMGAVIRGIEYCHQRLFALGVREEWVTGLALVRAAWGIARREAVFAEGVELTACLDGEAHHGKASIFLVSALERLLLGIRPFWGEGPGPLDVTWVAADARRFLRTFPALLRGEARRLSERDGYLSRRSRRIEVHGDGHYTVDGEIYRPKNGHLVIDGYGPLGFVPLGVAA